MNLKLKLKKCDVLEPKGNKISMCNQVFQATFYTKKVLSRLDILALTYWVG